jgi:hypothetical protein
MSGDAARTSEAAEKISEAVAFEAARAL